MLRLQFAAAAIALGVLASPAAAGDKAQAPEEFVTETVNKVLAVLARPEYEDESKRQDMRKEIRDILLKATDMETLCTLTLSIYRKKFSDEQFESFQETFSSLLFFTYISHIENYRNEEVVILDTRKLRPGQVQIKTKVVSSAAEVPIDYNLNQSDGQWAVFDVYVEGVSLVKNYRSQFREILRKSSAEDFLKRIEKKVEANEKSA